MSDLLRDQWGSLGVAFDFGGKSECDPETALVNFVSSREFPEDKKMISIILIWLKEYSALVHVEKLKNMTKGLGPEALAIMGVLACKCVQFGDHRWKLIGSLAIKNLKNKKINLADDERFIKIHGLDQDFLKFGLRVTPIVPENPKKLYTREKTIKMNAWLRNRVLFGSNLRADIATAQSLKIANTAYAASKLLGCSLNAAYRNWNDLKEAGWATE